MNKNVDIRKYIDHTNLRNNLTFDEIKQFCKEAIDLGFFAVCIQSFFLDDVISFVKSSDVKVVTVADFPYGTGLTRVRINQVEELVKLPVDELDLVMNIPAFINKRFDVFEKDIELATEICHSHNVKIKIIIETGILLPEDIETVTRILCTYNVDYIKTSTGIVSRGATYEDIEIIKENLSGTTKIKASGGIRTLEQVEKFIEIGASRIGTSNALAILKEFTEKRL